MLEVKKNDLFYYVGLLILVLISWEYFSKIMNFGNSILYGLYMVASICFLVNLVASKYTKKEVLVLLAITLVMVFSTVKMREFNIILSFFAIISSKGIPTKNIVKCLFVGNLFFLFLHAFLTLTGIFPETGSYYTYLDQTVRHTFNLRHPNYLAATMFWTLGQFIYLNIDGKKTKNLLLIFLVALITYFITYSRTTIALFSALGLIVLLNNTSKQEKIYKVAKIIAFLLVMGSIYLSFHYHLFSGRMRALFDILNEILSQRLYLSNYALQYFDLTFFGHIILQNTSNLIIIDSFYVSCLVQYGMISMIFLLLSFLKYPIRENTAFTFALFMIVILAGITERYIIFITIAFPLLFIRDLFKEKKELE